MEELDKETKEGLSGLCNCLFNSSCELDGSLTNFLWGLKNSFLDAKNKPPEPPKSFFDRFRYMAQLIAYNARDNSVHLMIDDYKIDYHPDETSLMWITRKRDVGYAIKEESKRILFESEKINIEDRSRLLRKGQITHA